jgi:Ca-activated chloride channel homolog
MKMSNWFTNPNFLWFLLLLPSLFFWKIKTKNNSGIFISNTAGFTHSKNIITQLRPYLFVLQLLAIFCLTIALARPRSIQNSSYTNATNGVDIVIATDVSASMLAEDLLPNRLEAVKEVAATFVNKRVNDRIGLVVYAGESYTKIPITSDKGIILKSLSEIQYSGGVIQDGTAIGLGLGTAINRIKDSKAKSRVIILLTDGVNNQGSLDPISAAEIAKEYGIKVYTVGVGTNGMANFPVGIKPDGTLQLAPQKVEIDEKLLTNIASLTSGKYFRATDNKKLSEIYSEIDQLEKSVVKEEKLLNYNEFYRIWAAFALFFMFLDVLLRKTIFKSFV